MQLSRSEQIGTVIIYIVLGVISIIALYPFVYAVSVSVSDTVPVMQGKVWLFPDGFNLSAYRGILSDPAIWMAYWNAIFITVVGTMVNMFVTVCGAYPLSKKRLTGGSILMFMVAFTMWFNPPTMLMIPFFLHVKSLGLDDTRTSVILAFAANAFNVILLRTYFQSIPDSMEESAKIDGANDLKILWKIILPLSIPAVATISLYYAVSRWNGYFWTMVFIKDPSKIPLQVLLRKLVVEMSFVSELGSDYTAYTPETFVYATIMVGIIPMMMAYPFIQKYFVKGIMVGALKE